MNRQTPLPATLFLFGFVSLTWLAPAQGPSGDVTYDGRVSQEDAAFEQSYLLGRVGFTTTTLSLADINEDRGVDLADLLLTKLAYPGQDSTFIPSGPLRLVSQIVGSQIGGNTHAAAIQGNRAYVGESRMLRVVDISDPGNLIPMGAVSTAEEPFVIAVAETHVIVSTLNQIEIIDVSDSDVPKRVGFYYLPETARGMAVVGSIAYLALGHAGIMLVDISNPAHVAELGTYQAAGLTGDITVRNSIAYAADTSEGLLILDVEDPSNVELIGSYPIYGANSIAVAGSLAYATTHLGFEILDIHLPRRPELLGSYRLASLKDVAVTGDIAYMTSRNGLQIFNVADPTSPTLLSSVDTGYARFVQVQDSLAYVTNDTTGLQIVAVSDPLNPSTVGNVAQALRPTDVAVEGSIAYLADGDAGLETYDVSDPENPFFLGRYKECRAQSLVLRNSLAYIGDSIYGLQIVDVSDPSKPFRVGGFATPGGALYFTLDQSIAYIETYLPLKLYAIDVSIPTTPTLRSITLIPINNIFDPVVRPAASYPLAFSHSSLIGLTVADISTLPPQYNRVPSWMRGCLNRSIVASEGILYRTCGNNFEIINYNNLLAPALMGSHPTRGISTSFFIKGEVVYIRDDEGIQVLDISNPSTPVMITSYPDTPAGLDVEGEFVFLADGSDGFKILRYN